MAILLQQNGETGLPRRSPDGRAQRGSVVQGAGKVDRRHALVLSAEPPATISGGQLMDGVAVFGPMMIFVTLVVLGVRDDD